MANLESISARDLSSKVNKAVQAALKRNEKFKNVGTEAGPAVAFPPWLIGFILRDPPKDATVGDLQKIAVEVGQTLGAAEQRIVLVQQLRQILVGFFPVEVFSAFRE
jgi:hypothetical protein